MELSQKYLQIFTLECYTQMLYASPRREQREMDKFTYADRSILPIVPMAGYHGKANTSGIYGHETSLFHSTSTLSIP